jgi:hypothetical protein
MEKINQILGKHGVLILVVFTLLTFINTCGTKGKIQQSNKRIDQLERTIREKDSLNAEIQAIQREINMYQTAREVVYTNNAIVRQVTRPDDVMNDYSAKIDDLRKKLDRVKNGK